MANESVKKASASLKQSEGILRGGSKKALTQFDAIPLREKLSSNKRVYIYDEDIFMSYDKNFRYTEKNRQYLLFAQDSMGVVGDCYIAYAVSMMGAADKKTIIRFLADLKSVEKELSIPDPSNAENIDRRIDTLIKDGFLFSHHYRVPYDDGSGVVQERDLVIYTIVDDGVALVNNKLGKKVVSNSWFPAKPLYELIGWASANYVATMIAAQPGFREFMQGICRTKMIGTVMFPVKVKQNISTQEDHPGYIGVFPSYLYFNKRVQTEHDYRDACFRFANSIWQYLYTTDVQKKYGRVVIVVQDNNDLVEACTWLSKIESLKENYGRIFFTGEGLIKENGGLKGSFMRMAATKDGGYEIIPASPDFVSEK